MDDVFKQTKYLGPEADLVLEILDLRDNLGIVFCAKHVRSHQGKRRVKPLEVQLSEDCDANAKRFLHNDDPACHSLPTAAPALSAMASLIINDQLITNNMPCSNIKQWRKRCIID